MTTTAQAYLEQAIRLAQAGQKLAATNLLRHVVRMEPDHLAAWRWLVFTTDDPREAQYALQILLRANPADPWARQAWENLTGQPLPLPSAAQVYPPQSAAKAPRRNRGILPIWLSIAGTLFVAIAMTVIVGLRLWDTFSYQSVSGYSLAEVIATSPPPVEPNSMVTISTETEYYSFQAATAPEIRQALFDQGPRLANGDPSIAVTLYEMVVNWQMMQVDDACRVTDAVVQLNLTYTYPRWEPAGNPPANLYNEWDRFINHVIEHEETHGRIAVGCANEIAAYISTISPASSCDQLESSLDAKIEEVYQICDQRQQEYDDVEGRTSFPLP